ncbi:MAG: ADP-ribosylglycohydrolase family protein, partial [Sphaerochaetaceae bacterium]
NEVSLEGYRVALPLSVVLAIAGIELTQKQLKEIAVKTTSNFCEEAIEREATALLTHCLYLLVTQEVAEGKKLIHTLLTQRGGKGIDERLRSILEQAKEPKITLAGNHSLRETLVLVFHTIYHASSVERGMSKIAKEGGDARLACGLYGAIQGAQYGPTLFKERWIGELVPSSAIEQAIKRQTLFRRETIKMEKLAFTLGERLLTSELLGR